MYTNCASVKENNQLSHLSTKKIVRRHVFNPQNIIHQQLSL